MRSSEGKAFGELLGQFRTEAKLTQQKLAVLMQKARGTIVNWENGIYLPKERALVLELAKILHLDSLKRDQLLEAALFDPLGTVWTIPFQRNPFFTGREDILNYLQMTLSTGKTVTLMQPQALKGLGGIGKTHTAIEYAYRHHDEYQAILWAPATTSSILQASLVSIATILNLPQKTERDQDLIVKAVKQWLMNHSDWLLILDNVEDLESVGLLYPWAHSGHVIITTRSQSVGGIALSITLEKMEPEEGALFLLRRATLIGPQEGKEQAKGTDYEKAKELSEVLGGLPLALDQAAAYIEKTRCSLSAYLKLYQTQRAKLLSERGSLTTDHPESVTVTFSLAFQKVESVSAAAGELLRFCAFLSPDAIPEEIITNGRAYLGPTLETIATDPLEFNTAIEILLAYSLIRRDTDIGTGTQILSVHQLVQTVLQDAMETPEQETWTKRVVIALDAVFPEPTYEFWEKCIPLVPHVLIHQKNDASQEDSLVLASLLNKTAIYLFERAQYEQAEPLSQRVLQIREQMLGSEHPDVASALDELAILYAAQDKYEQAELLYQRALRISEQTLGSEHPGVASTLNNLAELYRRQGKYEQAEPLYQRALQIWEQTLGLEHPDIAALLNELAILYTEQGKYEQAETLHQQALQIWEQSLGMEHFYIAYSLSGLAAIYQEQGKYEQAESFYQRALHLWEQALGSEHPSIASFLNGLANLYREQGKYTESEPLYQRALRIRKHYLGSRHPDTAEVLHDFAALQYTLGNVSEAESLYQHALGIREQSLGPQHPKTMETRRRYATLLRENGRREEADLLVAPQLELIKTEEEPEAD
jgi:tetratricopeptide (TPR) repeat protein/DNA-binding XRE family transcriptional regulator